MTRFFITILCLAVIATGVIVYQHQKAITELAHSRPQMYTEEGIIEEPTPQLERTVIRLMKSVNALSNASQKSITQLQKDLTAVTARLDRVDGIATRLMDLAQKNLRKRDERLAALSAKKEQEEAAAKEAARLARGPKYTDDLTVWPNNKSKANSDQWIVDNHDSIRVMKPRLLVINFADELSRGDMRNQTEQLIEALKEASSWHGYKQSSPAFMQYDVWKYVDCPDCPVKEHNNWLDYDQLYSEKYAKYWGIKDPDVESKYLTLVELVERGYVHELWMFFDPDDKIGAFESIEWKPVYDKNFKRKKDEYRMAGNGGDPDVRWTGRSLRFNCLNKDRGIGCGMENLGHSFEGTSNSGCIPYFTKYFKEYAMFDMKERFGTPFRSLYETKMEPDQVRYPNKTTAVVTYQGKEYTITNYIVTGGNVHFPPNARQHYDQRNNTAVMSTIENWRMRNGENGKDKAEPWKAHDIPRKNEKLAPDCMGPWLIYWRQNMPGLDNEALDDEGKPMKNWWPFLFY